MTRLLSTAALAALLALPALAQTAGSGTATDTAPGSTMQSAPAPSAAKPAGKAQGNMQAAPKLGDNTATDKPSKAKKSSDTIGMGEEAAPSTQKHARPAASDPEHSRVVELNQQQLRQIESGQNGQINRGATR